MKKVIFSSFLLLSFIALVVHLQPQETSKDSPNKDTSAGQKNTEASKEKKALYQGLKFGKAYPFQSNGLAIIQGDNGRYGLINNKGETVLPPKFLKLWPFSHGLAKFRGKNTLFGFVNKKGKVVIPPKFKMVKDFREGLAPYLYKKKWGYINKRGAVAIKSKYKKAFSFYNGRARFVPYPKDDVERPPVNHFGYLARNGKVAIAPRYGYTGDFVVEGKYAIVEKNNKFGLINKAGKVVLRLAYESLVWQNDAYLVANRNYRWGYIDVKSLSKKISFQYKAAAGFREGLAAVRDRHRRWGYINKQGKLVIPYKFHKVSSFYSSRAAVYLANKGYGVIDKNGSWVVKPSHSFISNFKKGLAVVRTQKGKYGIIDAKGNWLVPPVHDKIFQYNRGLAPFAHGGKWGYLDRQGEVVSWSSTASKKKEKEKDEGGFFSF